MHGTNEGLLWLMGARDESTREEVPLRLHAIEQSADPLDRAIEAEARRDPIGTGEGSGCALVGIITLVAIMAFAVGTAVGILVGVNL